MPTPTDAASATHTMAGALLVAGEDPASVASLMRELDCGGRRDHPASNPISNYLTRYGIRSPEVRWTQRGYVAQSTSYDHHVSVPLPDPAAMFLAQFDAGQWPDLIAE